MLQNELRLYIKFLTCRIKKVDNILKFPSCRNVNMIRKTIKTNQQSTITALGSDAYYQRAPQNLKKMKNNLTGSTPTGGDFPFLSQD